MTSFVLPQFQISTKGKILEANRFMKRSLWGWNFEIDNIIEIEVATQKNQ